MAIALDEDSSGFLGISKNINSAVESYFVAIFVRQQTAVFFADTHTHTHTHINIYIYRRTQTLNPPLRIGAG